MFHSGRNKVWYFPTSLPMTDIPRSSNDAHNSFATPLTPISFVPCIYKSATSHERPKNHVVQFNNWPTINPHSASTMSGGVRVHHFTTLLKALLIVYNLIERLQHKPWQKQRRCMMVWILMLSLAVIIVALLLALTETEFHVREVRATKRPFNRLNAHLPGDAHARFWILSVCAHMYNFSGWCVGLNQLMTVYFK